jgi:RNA polymerase sigma factor (sigma-70 family)
MAQCNHICRSRQAPSSICATRNGGAAFGLPEIVLKPILIAIQIKRVEQTIPYLTAADYESAPTRRSLLSRLRDLDDATSWQTFFETYWRLIYNVARKSGLGDSEAQDIVQETVIAVAKKIPEFRYDPAKGSFKGWLLLITRRRIQDHLRRVYRSLPSTQGDTEEIARRTESVVSPEPTPDAAIDEAWESEWRDNFFQAALARVRQRVTPKNYQVFDACVLQNLPAPQVARMLGLSLAQVYLAKHRVSRAVKRAVTELETELDQPGS